MRSVTYLSLYNAQCVVPVPGSEYRYYCCCTVQAVQQQTILSAGLSCERLLHVLGTYGVPSGLFSSRALWLSSPQAPGNCVIARSSAAKRKSPGTMHDQRSRDPGSKGHPSSRRVRRKDLENGRKKNVSKLKRLCIVWNTRHPKVPHDPSKSWHVLGGFTCHARHAMMSASNGNAQWATGAMPRRSNGTQGTRRRDPQPERNSTLARIVQRFDVYAKVDDDLQVKTETGAAVTIGFWLLMVVLVVGEVQAYLRVQPAIERVVVDSTMGQRVRINADIVSV